MSVDQRGFAYALEPLLRQRQWRVDGIRARLGRMQRDIDELRQAMAELASLHRASAENAAHAFATAADARAHARHLQWLVTLNARQAALQDRLAALQVERRSLQQDCARAQLGVDAVEAHRALCLEQHVRERSALAAAEADRDWLVRVAVATPSMPTKGTPA